MSFGVDIIAHVNSKRFDGRFPGELVPPHKTKSYVNMVTCEGNKMYRRLQCGKLAARLTLNDHTIRPLRPQKSLLWASPAARCSAPQAELRWKAQEPEGIKAALLQKSKHVKTVDLAHKATWTWQGDSAQSHTWQDPSFWMDVQGLASRKSETYLTTSPSIEKQDRESSQKLLSFENNYLGKTGEETSWTARCLIQRTHTARTCRSMQYALVKNRFKKKEKTTLAPPDCLTAVYRKFRSSKAGQTTFFHRHWLRNVWTESLPARMSEC